jgi:hypothetical protein
MNKLVVVLMFLTVGGMTVSSVVGQKQLDPWQEWSKKDAEKVLNDSPWAQLQLDMDFEDRSPLLRGRDADVRARLMQDRGLTYGIRFFSARPVRQAFARMIQLRQKNLPPETVARLNTFAERASANSIIIAVTVEGPDANVLGKAMQIVRNAATPTLQNTTYLERSDGKRVFLEQYTPPGSDGFGARFIFPRMVDDRPFLTPEIASVRFVSDLGNSLRFEMKFKVADMMLNGQLEY